MSASETQAEPCFSSCGTPWRWYVQMSVAALALHLGSCRLPHAHLRYVMQHEATSLALYGCASDWRVCCLRARQIWTTTFVCVAKAFETFRLRGMSLSSHGPATIHRNTSATKPSACMPLGQLTSLSRQKLLPKVCSYLQALDLHSMARTCSRCRAAVARTPFNALIAPSACAFVRRLEAGMRYERVLHVAHGDGNMDKYDCGRDLSYAEHRLSARLQKHRVSPGLQRRLIFCENTGQRGVPGHPGQRGASDASSIPERRPVGKTPLESLGGVDCRLETTQDTQTRHKSGRAYPDEIVAFDSLWVDSNAVRGATDALSSDEDEEGDGLGCPSDRGQFASLRRFHDAHVLKRIRRAHARHDAHSTKSAAWKGFPATVVALERLWPPLLGEHTGDAPARFVRVAMFDFIRRMPSGDTTAVATLLFDAIEPYRLALARMKSATGLLVVPLASLMCAGCLIASAVSVLELPNRKDCSCSRNTRATTMIRMKMGVALALSALSMVRHLQPRLVRVLAATVLVAYMVASIWGSLSGGHNSHANRTDTFENPRGGIRKDAVYEWMLATTFILMGACVYPLALQAAKGPTCWKCKLPRVAAAEAWDAACTGTIVLFAGSAVMNSHFSGADLAAHRASVSIASVAFAFWQIRFEVPHQANNIQLARRAISDAARLWSILVLVDLLLAMDVRLSMLSVVVLSALPRARKWRNIQRQCALGLSVRVVENVAMRFLVRRGAMHLQRLKLSILKTP